MKDTIGLVDGYRGVLRQASPVFTANVAGCVKRGEVLKA
jgi:hypothetical protein